MGFWQGLNEGLTYVMDEKARQKELAGAKQERMEERDAAKAERDADRAAAREEAQARIKAAGITAFAPLAIAYANQNKASGEMLAKQADLLGRLTDVDKKDPKYLALAGDAFQASALEDQIRAAELKRQGNGNRDDSPFRGQNLLDNAVGVTSAGEPVIFPDPFELLAEIDFADAESVARAQARFAVPERVINVRLDPKVYFTADPKLLEEGRKTFDQLVLNKAQTNLNTYDVTGGAWGDLNDAIVNYGKDDLAARMELQNKYGYKAFKEMVGLNSAYLSNAKDDPQFTSYVNQYKEEMDIETTALLADPESSQEDKNRTMALRRTWGLD